MALEAICDSYLMICSQCYSPPLLSGVGKYAENKLITVAQAFDDITVGSILPSLINPKANQGWARIGRNWMNWESFTSKTLVSSQEIWYSLHMRERQPLIVLAMTFTDRCAANL